MILYAIARSLDTKVLIGIHKSRMMRGREALWNSVKDGKILEKEKYTTDLNDNMYSGMNTRVTYVDDYYYVIDNTLDVKSFELK